MYIGISSRMWKKALYIGAITIAAVATVSAIVWLIYELGEDFYISDKDCDKAKKGKLVIDNDAGVDDAMAIFLALLYEKNYDGPELVALTTGNGNTKEDNVCVNNKKILKIAGRQDVPIYRGSKASLVTTVPVTDYFGVDGLGDTGEVFTDLVEAKEENAVNALIRLSKTYKGNLTVVTLGALTNLAMAISLDPDFLKRIGHLYVAAGHIHNADNSDPEFNANMDVEGYHIVLKHATPDKVTTLPFSQVIQYLTFSKDWRNNVLGAIPTEIMRQLNKFEQVSLAKEEHWGNLDPAMIAVILRQDLVSEYKYSSNDIIICGEKRGLNTNTFCEKEKGNTRIIYSIKSEEYKKFILEVFAEKK